MDPDPQTHTHELKPINPDPQNRRSTSDHDPRPSAEHNHRQSTLIGEAQREKRDKRSGERKEKEEREPEVNKK